MQLKNLLPVALATAASAQQMMDLAAALGSIPELSNLTNTVSAFPELVSGLSMTPNLTLLAPSNEAFAELLQSDMASALQDPAMITALLQYHVLNGTYYAANVTETPLFLPTALMNMTYENVTGGQVVEAVMSQNQVVFYSGLRMNSTVTQAVSRLGRMIILLMLTRS